MLRQVHIELTFPIRLISEANTSEHWTARAKRRKAQSTSVRIWWAFYRPNLPSLPITLHLIRQAPRTLDNDNLLMSFKTVRDTLADIILSPIYGYKRMGNYDSHPSLIWEYSQEKTPKNYSFLLIINKALDEFKDDHPKQSGDT